MSQILRLLLVVVLVGLGLRISRLSPGIARRRGQTVFIAFVMLVSVAVGVSQKDAWPFSPYPFLAEDATRGDVVDRVLLKAVDAAGGEWDVHPLAFSPLPSTKIEQWIKAVYPKLDVAEQRRVERFLLQRAEAARRAAWTGETIGRRRILGALAAPDWMVMREPPVAGDRPFVALRAYMVLWRPREILGDPRRLERHLLFDTAQP